MSRWMATEKPCDGSKAVPVVDAADYDQLKVELAKRDAAIEEWSGVAVQNGMEVDRLSKQIGEARELLGKSLDYMPAGWLLYYNIDTWLEANKP